MCYFGARYGACPEKQSAFGDARLSRWISADPPLSEGEYFPTGDSEQDANLPGVGGVFNPVNLDGYQYAGMNPVVLTDPDGNADIEAIVEWANKMKGTLFDDWSGSRHNPQAPKVRRKERSDGWHYYKNEKGIYSDRTPEGKLGNTEWKVCIDVVIESFTKGGIVIPYSEREYRDVTTMLYWALQDSQFEVMYFLNKESMLVLLKILFLKKVILL